MKHKISALSGKRLLSVFLAATLCLSMLPGTALAVRTGSTDTNRTVFDALGFDTSAPEGFDQDESLAGTPYGKTYTTMAEVDELLFGTSGEEDSAEEESEARHDVE